MLVVTLMGFSSGLPLLLIGSTLKFWMREEGVDLTLIGIFSLVGMPYTLKFVWAPLLDRYFVSRFGRRRFWLYVFQIGLILSLFMMSMLNPKDSPALVGALAFLIAFLSASQDIVVDAYRREALPDNELGFGSSMYVNGYRVALLAAGAGALFIAEATSWAISYQMMAIGIGVGLVTTLFCSEPEVEAHPPQSLKEAVLGPLIEYFSRHQAVLFLLFILMFKLGDQMASEMLSPFYVDTGFSKSEVAWVSKIFGFWAVIVGGTIGGLLIIRIGINRALWIFGALQMISTFGFSVLDTIGHKVEALAVVIGFENLASGMGTAAFAAYMAALTNKKFTATQYALLTSLLGVPRTLFAAPTGWMAENLGWFNFFLTCTLLAIPGMLMLYKVAPWKATPNKSQEK